MQFALNIYIEVEGTQEEKRNSLVSGRELCLKVERPALALASLSWCIFYILVTHTESVADRLSKTGGNRTAHRARAVGVYARARARKS
jgi:hypothetical protein